MLLTDSFYNECHTRSSQITSLLSELSQVQRSQKDFQFDFGSVDATANARLEFSKIRSQLANYHAQIEENVHEAERLCQEGAETLSPDQFHALKENQQRLKSTYEGLIRQTDGVLDRLDIATALLIEFSTRSSKLQSWIFDKSRAIDSHRLKVNIDGLAEAKKLLKPVEEEIHSMAGELKEISQLGVRIDVEICKYIDELRKKEVASHPQMHRHHITETVERVQEDYAALVRAKNEYSQYLNRLKSLNSQHEDNLMSINRWLSELERSITHTGLNPVDTEARLAQLLQLKQSTVESQHKLDKFKQSAQQLVDATAGTDAHDAMQVEQQGQLNKVYKRYEALSNRIEEGVNSARAEITEKEGLKQGLESMNQWLDSAESKMLSVQPLPLNQTELNDLKYEDQLKRSELTSKAKTLLDLSQLLRRMRLTSPTLNQLEEKGIEDALNSTHHRFNKLNTTVNGLSHNLLDLISSLDQFHLKQSEMGVEQASLIEAIANLETTDQKALAQVEDRLAKLVNDDWPTLEKYAKRMLSMPNLASPSPIHQQMKNTSQALQRLQTSLAIKLEAGQKVSENRMAFDEKYTEVDQKLGKVEEQLQQEMYSALDLKVLEQQLEQCNNLKSELRVTRNGINELEELGSRFMGAAGQSSRKSVHEGGADQALLGQITQQLFEIRKRQEDAERQLQDLIQKIAQSDEHLRGWNTQHSDLHRWLSSEHNQLMHLQKGSIQKLVGLQPGDPQNKTVLASLHRELAGYVIRRRDKQPDMAAFRIKTQQMIGSLDEEAQSGGSNTVSTLYVQLNKEWNGLEESTDRLEKCGHLITTLLGECSAMDKWLVGKTKMLKEACGLSADMNMLNNMMILLQMLENEYKDEEGGLFLQLNDTAGEVVRLSDNDAFANKLFRLPMT